MDKKKMKKGSVAWKKREEELKVRALVVLATMQDFKVKLFDTVKQIEAFMYKYPRSMVDELEWSERERLLGVLDRFYKDLKSYEKKLSELDVVYNNLMKEVNEFYGRVVMPGLSIQKMPSFPTFPPIDSVPEDPADWWKKC